MRILFKGIKQKPKVNLFTIRQKLSLVEYAILRAEHEKEFKYKYNIR